MGDTGTAPRWFFPDLPGFEGLFGQTLFDRQKNARLGFRPQSSIVLEGSPGAGKTAAALSICRTLMAERGRESTRLYYLSSEVGRSSLEKNFDEFGWFGDESDSSPFRTGRIFFAELPRLEMDRPLASSVDLINEVFRQLNAERRQNRNDYGSSLVIVDSLSGFLRDASNPGDRRRHTEDFLSRLKTLFGNDLGLVFLISEATHASGSEAQIEQYIADYVFRLGYRETPGGKRTRTWEVLKSHGTYMVSGAHTWGIYTKSTSETFIWDKNLRNRLKHVARNPAQVDTMVDGSPGEIVPVDPEATSRSGYATIIFFPQWSVHLRIASESHFSEQEPGSDEALAPEKRRKRIWSGTPGLDELMLDDSEYWSRADKWYQGTGQFNSPLPQRDGHQG